MIASTFGATAWRGGLQEIPRMTDRERDAVVAAIDSGEFVPVVNVRPNVGASVVAVMAPEHVDRFCAGPDDSARERLADRIAELRDELSTLSQVVREVMAEKSPGDFRDRIENCIDDAREILSGAENAAEDL